eukprot:6869241-Ditylum_brightwellii.AAC.1
MCAFYLTSQKEGMTLEAYLDEFNNRKNIVEQCSGDISVHTGLTENALKDMNIDPKDPNNYSTDNLKEAHCTFSGKAKSKTGTSLHLST